ncbi:MAG TPA: polysaccharide biosynthesis/export family protein [Methylomirabilota bacterium]|nr:polysaccharide biosynthesis/export family protein [Methylomirabilota bacterium]
MKTITMETSFRHATPAVPGALRRPAAGAGWNSVLLLFAISLGCWWGTGCKSTPISSPAAPEAAVSDPAVAPVATKIQEGDVLSIQFGGASELNTTQRVPLDGKIMMPFIGEVQALGKTPQELKEELTKRYEPQLRTAEVRVTVTSTVSAVYVSGAVLKPGRVPLERPMTVLDALMEVGGADLSRANLAGVRVLRIEGGQRKTYNLNLKKALSGADPSLFFLKPFDIIYVPQKTFNF